jgi:catechol 2,3-dioxygenase-like lactoylglutathione lyase family enzyme
MSVSDIRFKRLGYLGLNVSDLQASRDFYVKMVGLEAIEANAGKPDHRMGKTSVFEKLGAK